MRNKLFQSLIDSKQNNLTTTQTECLSNDVTNDVINNITYRDFCN